MERDVCLRVVLLMTKYCTTSKSSSWRYTYLLYNNNVWLCVCYYIAYKMLVPNHLIRAAHNTYYVVKVKMNVACIAVSICQ